MSYIPNIREKYSSLFSVENHEGNKKNYYWQGYLNDKGIDILSGYDTCLEVIPNITLELQLGSFNDELKEKLNVALYEKYNIDREYSDLEMECFADVIANFIDFEVINRIEASRDDLGVYLIENMKDKEHEHIVKEVDSGRRKNVYTKIDE